MRFLLFLFSSFFLFCSFVYGYTEHEHNSANILAEKGIIVAQTDPILYRLDDTITRKEFMKVFVLLIGSEVEDKCDFSFRDVGNDWWCKYIEWALRNSHIAKNLDFRPRDQITKAEAMKLILKARWVSRVQSSWDWRFDDMVTARKRGIIELRYYDYDTYASRGWIFAVAATPLDTFDPIEHGWWDGSGGTWGSSSSSSGWGVSDNCEYWECTVP